jgi:hypothetical protein
MLDKIITIVCFAVAMAGLYLFFYSVFVKGCHERLQVKEELAWESDEELLIKAKRQVIFWFMVMWTVAIGLFSAVVVAP